MDKLDKLSEKQDKLGTKKENSAVQAINSDFEKFRKNLRFR
jgi:hypothetical protein